MVKRFWKYAALVFFILITFSYAMFEGGFVSWFLFYSFVPFAAYGFALIFYPLNEFEVERKLSKTDFSAGENLDVTISIKRNSFFPLFYVIFEDHLAVSMDLTRTKKTKFLLFPGFKKEFSYKYTIYQLERGEHLFASYHLKTGDPIGLMEKEKTFPAKEKIVVYPSYTELSFRLYENSFDQGMSASRERVQRDTSMAVGVRDYQQGDRFSWINWKASAKRNEMMTKEFEQRQSNHVSVLMDCASDPRFEAIVSFTASLLRAAMKTGAQAGLLTVGRERASFPVRGGEAHLQTLFYHLAKIQPYDGLLLDKVIGAENSLLQQQAVSLLVVTAQLTNQLIEKLSLLDRRRAGAVTIFFVKGKNERPSKEELALKSKASIRGLRVVLIQEGKETMASSEVNFR